MNEFDVIVVGAGHAGVEAADAAARRGARVALISFSKADLGKLSCNPAIGGLGKGHIVREIDALGGVMGRAADRGSIGYRLLNRRKGPAVRGPRAQIDRDLYRTAIANWLARSDVTFVAGEVAALTTTAGRVTGVSMSDGSVLSGRAVVIASGTFLGGRLFRGAERLEGGRIGDRAATSLGRQLRSLGLTVRRLKTGTPPRLDGRTIDWARLDWQRPDERPHYFSALTSRTHAPQISCAISHTNAETHDIVAAHIGESATYSGDIEGTGPRYCPSIEDKVVRFADREAHQVFLEPEALRSSLIYPNGISTALPASVQLDLVRTMRGLERTEIVEPGYAVEYDHLCPTQMDRSLQSRALKGLYLAGQINGTTGYEEAAGQGLVAGANAAAAALDEAALMLARADSYIGVMVDDLVGHGVSEPYRMFTSRAEFRLSLRIDNAHRRLTPLATELGLATADLTTWFERHAADYDVARKSLQESIFSPTELRDAGMAVRQDGVRRAAFEWLRFPDVNAEALFDLAGVGNAGELLESLVTDSTYQTYLERQERDAARLRSEDDQRLPEGLDYRSLPGLSNEMAERLERAKPMSVGEARGVPGITPAALLILMARAA
ncbi:tRNA uridine-5-carboxymethylaminomethyl(34) synthesis enzyme MnmG [Pacificimonas flava]|uniref:tRNA uridine 5-carboxymethylaminomethyl modification enzyme MnmG n=1 Tax=Pacificimonas flava TaxID=1234595 RepID=A0A219BA20_9SPHN|nr:tRNA uridine-5-carboxymethylaminomethyl(34) synthesis enzyme MnmG [Pacificimonas flava]